MRMKNIMAGLLTGSIALSTIPVNMYAGEINGNSQVIEYELGNGVVDMDTLVTDAEGEIYWRYECIDEKELNETYGGIIPELDISLVMMQAYKREDMTYGFENTHTVNLNEPGITIWEGLDEGNNLYHYRIMVKADLSSGWKAAYDEGFGVDVAANSTDVDGQSFKGSGTPDIVNSVYNSLIGDGLVLGMDEESPLFTVDYSNLGNDRWKFVVNGNASYVTGSFEGEFLYGENVQKKKKDINKVFHMSNEEWAGFTNNLYVGGTEVELDQQTINDYLYEYNINNCGVTYLVKGEDYEIEYVNNDKPGVATLKIKGINDYTGSIEKQFGLYGDLSGEYTVCDCLSVECKPNEYRYENEMYYPVIEKVSYAGREMDKSDYYITGYDNQVYEYTDYVLVRMSFTVNAADGAYFKNKSEMFFTVGMTLEEYKNRNGKVEEPGEDNPSDPEIPDEPETPEDPKEPDNPVTPDPGNGDKPIADPGGDVTIPEKPKKLSCTSIYKKKYGDKDFYIKVKNASGKITYSSNNKKVATVNSSGKVTIKGCGYAKITVKAKNGKVTSKIYVAPKKATVSSIKSTKKKQMVVKWKKDTKADGYRIEYSTDKAFKKSVKSVNVKKNATTFTTIKNLKSKKKYYVRIRAYKNINGKKYYGTYSTVKSVKIK